MPKECKDIQVTTRPLAFSEPKLSSVPGGMTIAEVVRDHMPGVVGVVVQLNGEVVPAIAWGEVKPIPGDHLLIYTALRGGRGKNPVAMLLQMVVVVAATVYGGPLGGAAFGAMNATTAAIGSAVIMTAGTFLVQAIAPTRPQSNKTYSYEDSQTYSLSASRNTMDAWGPIPVILGRHLVFPKLGAPTYTEIVGQDEYLRILVIWGIGPLKISNIKIGDTPINNFDDVEIETRYGWPDDTPLTLFPSQVRQDQYGIEISQASGWITRSAMANVDELTVGIYFNALVEINRKTAQRMSRTVNLEIRYREVGASTWTPLNGTVDYAAGSISITDPYMLGADGQGSIYAFANGAVGNFAFGTIGMLKIATYTYEVGDFMEGSQLSFSITSVTNLPNSTKTGLECSLSGNTISYTAGHIVYPSIYYTAATPEARRFAYNWKVDRTKAYEVSVRRVTADSTSDYIVDKCYLGSITSIKCENPLNVEVPVACSAIRIRATGQLSGVVDEINGICSSYCPRWNGSAWTTGLSVQRNPAALFRHVLMSSANAKHRTAAQIHGAELGQAYAHCVTEGWTFDQVRDFTASVPDTLMDIAAAMRSSIAISDGLWSMIWDRADRPIAQHITPRNSWGFSSEKVLIDHPHAFRVKFKNELNNWAWDERIVYADGYNASNATLFESIEFPGVTHPDLIYKHARFHQAQALLRPEFPSVYMDFESLACKRGSKVVLSYDMMLIGSGATAGRVKSLTLGTGDDDGRTLGFVSDELFVMEVGKTYCCRFRLADESGSSLLLTVSTVAGETDTFTFVLDPPILTTVGPQAGDLFSFGEAGSETSAYLVHSVNAQNEYVRKINLVDEAEAIYSADTGTIPAYDPNITAPIDLTKLKPAAPTISKIESGEKALEVSNGVARARIFVTIAPRSGNIRVQTYRIRYRKLGEAAWAQVDIEAESTSTAVINGVEEGYHYQIQAAAISYYGVRSLWSSVISELVIGQTEPPDDVEDFAVNIIGTDAHLSWSPVENYDLSHYRIRWSPSLSGATWGTSVDIIKRVGKPATSKTAPALVGTYMIKAVDFAGNESDSADAVSTSIARITGLNVVETFEQTHPAWSGTPDGTEESSEYGGITIAAITSAGYTGAATVHDDSSVEFSDEGGTAFDSADPTETSIEVASGYYEFASYVDLLGVFTSRLSASLTISGQDITADLYAMGDLYAAGNLYGAQDGQYSVSLEVATTSDDPAGTPTWSAWKGFLVGDYTARAYKFRAKLVSYEPNITPILEGFSVSIDMPDRLVRFAAEVGTSGARVAFSPAFYITPEVGLSVLDGEEGDAYTMTNWDETGFDIAFTNGGSAVAREISGIAQAYGEQET
ncbi:MAG TPA: hypothetical protein DCZ95_18195 [Verrucomicrobia bacterium]|nr:hypothetical protein [Verrucomicrobiota bacterium]